MSKTSQNHCQEVGVTGLVGLICSYAVMGAVMLPVNEQKIQYNLLLFKGFTPPGFSKIHARIEIGLGFISKGCLAFRPPSCFHVNRIYPELLPEAHTRASRCGTLSTYAPYPEVYSRLSMPDCVRVKRTYPEASPCLPLWNFFHGWFLFRLVAIASRRLFYCSLKSRFY
ncbi:hypothetical protein Mettu_2160 [Methylobacter tundripaludum SV96]|uniref:Uncharacterized protein n=1 Tax=Methylobacter tundripaludum (strain ATCC BAA-1195 / DSM 17260 / SV96) TaxID=697282 RepID=G3IWV6_METTV|nr:hypothetical protein Mettu_2160 [Methylobacter tundripaludum SV96]